MENIHFAFKWFYGGKELCLVVEFRGHLTNLTRKL